MLLTTSCGFDCIHQEPKYCHIGELVSHVSHVNTTTQHTGWLRVTYSMLHYKPTISY